MFKRMLEIRKKNSTKSDYVDCSFILETDNEVEKMCSISDNRQNLTPQMFEALVFLKVNRKFSNEISVQKVNKLVK